MSDAAPVQPPAGDGVRALVSVFKRELGGYFATPVAYVFIVVFLALIGVFTFNQSLGGLYERGQADLEPMFYFLPWLYLFLIPAVTMRLWSEERRSGTIELLMTLPVPVWSAVLGKWLAAWAFTTVALLLTFPIWITINYLGDPDNGAVLTGYIGGILMAGSFLALGACLSAVTKSQVIAFVITAVACLVFVLAGRGTVVEYISGWAPAWLTEAVGSFGFAERTSRMGQGVIELRDIFFFVSLAAAALLCNTVIVQHKKAG
ncbi:MAG: ABC transporter permease subunit [Planctomycetota bacterium]